MAAVVAVIFFAVAFIFYAAKSGGTVPWTWQGFALLGLIAVAVHFVWSWWGTWRRPAP